MWNSKSTCSSRSTELRTQLRALLEVSGEEGITDVRRFDHPCPSGDVEGVLVLFAGKGMDREPPVPEQVVPLR